jgi:hypothetical protein
MYILGTCKERLVIPNPVASTRNCVIPSGSKANILIPSGLMQAVLS